MQMPMLKSLSDVAEVGQRLLERVIPNGDVVK